MSAVKIVEGSETVALAGKAGTEIVKYRGKQV
jgi:hypothetical protein